MDQTLVTLISVITASLVSILSIFVPMILDSRKAKRVSTLAERDRLETTTLDLLRELSNFRTPIWDSIEKSAGCPVQQAQSNLQVRHYAWECAIWSRLDQSHQQRVITLRERFEGLSMQEIGKLAKQVSDTSDEILALTRIASARL